MSMRSLALLLFIFLLSGCAGYKLGLPDAPFKRVYVEVARSDALAPQVQALITQQVSQALMRDSAVKVVDKSSADAVLTILVTKYDRNVSSTQSNDTARASSYNLTMEVNTSLLESGSGKAFYKDRIVQSTVSAYTDSGVQVTEYQSMPTLTRKLAEAIRTEVLSAW